MHSTWKRYARAPRTLPGIYLSSSSFTQQGVTVVTLRRYSILAHVFVCNVSTLCPVTVPYSCLSSYRSALLCSSEPAPANFQCTSIIYFPFLPHLEIRLLIPTRSHQLMQHTYSLRLGKVWDGMVFRGSIPYHGMIWYWDHIIWFFRNDLRFLQIS